MDPNGRLGESKSVVWLRFASALCGTWAFVRRKASRFCFCLFDKKKREIVCLRSICVFCRCVVRLFRLLW